MSKVGLHILIGPRTGYGLFLNPIADAGQSVTVIKCVGDFGPANDAKRLFGERVLTLGRKTGIGWEGLDEHVGSDSPDAIRDVAALHFTQVYRPAIESNPQIDVWEISNEWSAHWGWQADFYIALAPHFEAYSRRMGIYACSTGNPPDIAYAAIARACKALKARNAGHVLTLHEYGGVNTDDILTLRDTQPYHALRYRQLYAYLQANDAVIPLVLSETGQDGGATFIGTGAFVADYEWYDAHLMQDNYVVGCCAWTLGRWGSANFQEALPELADYIIAHPQPAPGDLPYHTYLPIVGRGAPPAESVSPGAVAAALALGAGAWMIGRRVQARRRVRNVG